MVVGSPEKKSDELRQIRRLEIDDDMPVVLDDALGDLFELVLRREVDQPLDEIEPHARARPPRCSRFNSASVTSRLTVAIPRALPPLASSASTIALLSAPWQVACTMTLRAKPRWSRNANNCALLASQGVYLRSGA